MNPLYPEQPGPGYSTGDVISPPLPAGPPVLLTADEIIAVADRTFEYVAVPEWGGTVKVRSLTGTERDRFEQSLIGKNNQVRNENFRAKLAQLTIVNEAGQLLFSKEQIAALGRKNAAALGRVADVATKLSGLAEDDVEKLEGE
ncbi:hypothetical protein [Herbidospora mongoliensis]|uniref:hypothetical protein n=1 Tax=Herbidospora mongoliensis TaxID=688067 RepID=UPI000AAC46F9|nr:hypothetical protein [Herbidospora mongoliensis]